MLTKAQQNRIGRDLDKGEQIYLEVNTGRYKGSICLLNEIRLIPTWRYHSYATQQNSHKHRYLLSAKGLIRNLSISPRDLSETEEGETNLTAEPIIKKAQVLPRDFSNTPINVNDHLFGNGKLIQVTAILDNNYVVTRCIKSNLKRQNDKISTHRTLRNYIKIEDPTQILLKI